MSRPEMALELIDRRQDQSPSPELGRAKGARGVTFRALSRDPRASALQIATLVGWPVGRRILQPGIGKCRVCQHRDELNTRGA
jgi:hypothetical protein